MTAARDNPFRSERQLALRYRLDASEWSALLARLDRLDHRAALVGPHGSGKTTLLEELEARLESVGWRIRRLRLGDAHRRPSRAEWHAAFANAGSETILTVDGAEQLGAWAWWRLAFTARRLGGLVVTTHRPGRLPTLREHRTDAALLGALVGELVDRREAERLHPLLPALFAEERGDLRLCLRRLYDLASSDGSPRAA